MTPIPNFDPLLVKLESFEGPLDLLLQFNSKKKKRYSQPVTSYSLQSFFKLC